MVVGLVVWLSLLVAEVVLLFIRSVRLLGVRLSIFAEVGDSGDMRPVMMLDRDVVARRFVKRMSTSLLV